MSTLNVEPHVHVPTLNVEQKVGPNIFHFKNSNTNILSLNSPTIIKFEAGLLALLLERNGRNLLFEDDLDNHFNYSPVPY